MGLFTTGFWILCILCVLLYAYTRSTLPSSNDPAFRKFQQTYLLVYLMAMGADWLQGPYVYALYESYQMKSHEIEILFVAGFGSSMLFGTVVGSLADKYGRRLNCIAYGVLYGLCCITKHFNNFYILLVGRLLGGIATSILYSAFESWLVYEHNKRGFDGDLMGTVFSHAVLGNSIVAILAGLLAQMAADMMGYVFPFDVSLGVLCCMCLILAMTWTENHGDSTATAMQNFKGALTAIRTDYKVMCLGLIQSLFEGSMYTFVLEWTPALTPHDPEPIQDSSRHLAADSDLNDGHRGTIPHGYIFAAFMVAIMIGSSLFKLLCKWSNVESFMRPVLLISSLSLLTPILFPGDQVIVFTGFLVFEVCVGIFWPSLSTMRSKYVPEATRATIMNFFRVPLNLIVVIILTQNLPMAVIFKCCVVFLLIATCFQQWLYRLVQRMPIDSARSTTKPDVESSEEEAPVEEDKKPLLLEEPAGEEEKQ